MGPGIAAGAVLVGLLMTGIHGGSLSPAQVATLATYAALMTAVCLLACVLPTRRALAVEPTEALRAEA